MLRVTEVIGGLVDPELLKWILKTPEKKRMAIREEAFRVGSLVDQLVQQDIKDGGYLIPEGEGDEVLSCMEGWEKFKRDFPHFVESVDSMQEEILDPEKEIVGHYDFKMKKPVKNTHLQLKYGIVDLKTGSRISPTYWTQTAEYSEIIRKALNLGEEPRRFTGILRLDKKEKNYEYIEVTDETFIRYEVEVFNALLLIYRHNETVREEIRKQLEGEVLGYGS